MPPSLSSTHRSEHIRAVIRVASGNFLEMYDFTVFGYYAVAISRAFVPASGSYNALLITLITFGAGFLVRPLGALVLGAYIDRHGRRKGLIVTLSLIAVGTPAIACVPGYATIRLLAPLLVVAGRLVQGFSAGVELGGVSVYLAEIATPGRKVFYVSWQAASQQVAVMLAALLGVILASVLPPDSMSQWGWRVPLLIGCLTVPVLFLIRRSQQETEAFLAQPRRPSAGEVMRTLGRHWRTVLLGMTLVPLSTVTFYMITVYTPTYSRSVLGLDATGGLVLAFFIGLSNFVWLPVMGFVSDHIGWRPVIFTCTLLSLVLGYPAMTWLVSQPSFGRLTAVCLWLSLMYASCNGVITALLTEIMPREVRTTGFAFSHAVATAIFGEFTPAICTWLIHVSGDAAMPGAWDVGEHCADAWRRSGLRRARPGHRAGAGRLTRPACHRRVGIVA